MAELKINIHAQNLIDHYQLHPHVEGGFFRETFRNDHGSCILFLLPNGYYSTLHRLSSDETWHFYLGHPLKLIVLSPNGNLSVVLLGSRYENGELSQYTVTAGNWFGAFLETDDCKQDFSFVGCSVYPPFEMKDFEIATMDKIKSLIVDHPEYHDVIAKVLK